MYQKKAAKEAFLRYAEKYDPQNTLIHHKIEHTFRVAELAERYAKAPGMGVKEAAPGMAAEDVALAWLLGLLHDIGRFEQVRRFGTFVDSESVDHAELSGDLLFREGLIDDFPQEGLPEGWEHIAEISIRLHNKLSLPGTLDARTTRFAEILRDADKTDIFRVIGSIPFEDRIGSSKGKYTEAGEASPEVMKCVKEHRCVPSGIRRSRFDGHISHCCMAFELVFEISRKTVKEEGWLKTLLEEKDGDGRTVWTGKQKEQLQILRREIEKAWGTSL